MGDEGVVNVIKSCAQLTALWCFVCRVFTSFLPHPKNMPVGGLAKLNWVQFRSGVGLILLLRVQALYFILFVFFFIHFFFIN